MSLFTDRIKKNDSTYEWFLILMTIFQASIFQYITWFWKPVDIEGYVLTTKLLVILIMPFIVSIVTWILGVIHENILWNIRFRLFSWGSIYICIFINALSLHRYIFLQYIFNPLNQSNIMVYPNYSSVPFTFLTIFILLIMSIIPTAIIYSLFNIIDNYGSFNTATNMILIPNLGLIIPFALTIVTSSMFIASTIY